jgi:hypothetical protein
MTPPFPVRRSSLADLPAMPAAPCTSTRETPVLNLRDRAAAVIFALDHNLAPPGA